MMNPAEMDDFTAYSDGFLLVELFPDFHKDNHSYLTGNNLNQNSHLLPEIAEILELSFIPEVEVEGNLCMINADEVRDDFRSIFTSWDLADYLYAVINSRAYHQYYKSTEVEVLRIPYPSPDTFWCLVRQGRKLRVKNRGRRES